MDTVGDLLDALRLPKWIPEFFKYRRTVTKRNCAKMETWGLADDSYIAAKNIKEQWKEILEK